MNYLRFLYCTFFICTTIYAQNEQKQKKTEVQKKEKNKSTSFLNKWVFIGGTGLSMTGIEAKDKKTLGKASVRSAPNPGIFLKTEYHHNEFLLLEGDFKFQRNYYKSSRERPFFQNQVNHVESRLLAQFKFPAFLKAGLVTEYQTLHILSDTTNNELEIILHNGWGVGGRVSGELNFERFDYNIQVEHLKIGAKNIKRFQIFSANEFKAQGEVKWKWQPRKSFVLRLSYKLLQISNQLSRQNTHESIIGLVYCWNAL